MKYKVKNMQCIRNTFLLFFRDQINEWGVRLNVPGRLSLLPNDLQVLVSKAMLATRHNNKLQLNIAYAYTGKNI